MSDDNFVSIEEKSDFFVIDECNAETGEINKYVGKENDLRGAIKKGMKYLKENAVEYGLVIKLNDDVEEK